jgi:hypothetical protein
MSKQLVERKESAKQWLQRISDDSPSTSARQAAAEDLFTWDQLMAFVPETAGGGWSLWELIGGVKGAISEPGPLFPGELALVSLTYKGAGFVFHIYQEAAARYGKRKAECPRGTIKAWLIPRNHLVRSPSRVLKPRPRFVEPSVPVATHDDGQLGLFDFIERVKQVRDAA